MYLYSTYSTSLKGARVQKVQISSLFWSFIHDLINRPVEINAHEPF